jgi:ATP-dependent RNA circularization protein (DNA/RNA ligase family)
VVRDLDLRRKLKRYPDLFIQGEILGSKIQGNKYGVPEGQYRLYVYNMVRVDGEATQRLGYLERKVLCEELGIEHVPVVDFDLVLAEEMDVPYFVDMSNGKSVLADVIREGIVIRSRDESISFKSVSPKFLLKYDNER